MEPIKITLKGTPQSVNHCYKTMCRGSFPTRYMTPKAKTLKEDYQWQIKQQYKGLIHTNPLKVKMKLYMKTHRKSDIDNFNKITFDSLTGLIWEDDSQIEDLNIQKFVDKENPRIELEIRRM